MLVAAVAALLGLFVMHGLGVGHGLGISHGPGHIGAQALGPSVAPAGGHTAGPTGGPTIGHAGHEMASAPQSHRPTLHLGAAGLVPLDSVGSPRFAEMCLAVLPVLLLSLLATAATADSGRQATTAMRSRGPTDLLGGRRPTTRHTPLYQLCILRA